MTGLLNLKRRGGLLFFRVGRLGGSFYLTDRPLAFQLASDGELTACAVALSILAISPGLIIAALN